MTDFSSDPAQPASPDAGGTPSAEPRNTGHLDRRGFLRALSGSALTLVAGGLTVSLSGCEGVGEGLQPLFRSSNVNLSPVSNSAPSYSSLSSFPPPTGSSGVGGGSSGSSGSSTGVPSSTTSSSTPGASGGVVFAHGFNTRF